MAAKSKMVELPVPTMWPWGHVLNNQDLNILYIHY